MKTAVLGYGTIGAGVYEMLKNAENLEPGPVLVRAGKEDAPFKTSDLNKILQDPEIGAVAEAIGGIDLPYEYAKAVLNAKKHFVTSNKALVAAKGPELARLAKENGVAFLFSAACGGGVPFLHNLALAVHSDEMESLGGILNGTTNFMLDSMQRKGMSYEEALKEAQNLGYAEADPTADVTGLDALRKIMLACAVAYGELPSEGLLNEGIDSFTKEDVEYLKKKGLTCRLIASAEKNGDAVSAYVEPVVFAEGAPECAVLANYNMAKYKGKNSGPIVLMGQGAGRYPTASAVLRDLSDILSGRMTMMTPETRLCKADNSSALHRYLVRVADGVQIPDAEGPGELYKGNRYLFTKPISVAKMHALAQSLRESGQKLFFAAVDES